MVTLQALSIENSNDRNDICQGGNGRGVEGHIRN